MEGCGVITVFDAYTLQDYTFLQLSRGGVAGNTATNTYLAQGVFKLRTGLVRGENSENKDSNATLHIKPSEQFVSLLGGNLIGHGIQVDDTTYQITGQTAGMNYHTGDLEHYTVTLQETELSDFGVGS